MNDTRPTVSVVIPCYNYGRYLADAIDSVLAQTHPPCQVIVVDDGSTDNTREVVRQYAGTVEYLALLHSGVCRARNEGLLRVTGEFVVFFDADDQLDRRFLECTLKEIMREDRPRVDFIYTQKRHFGEADGVSTFPEFDIERLKRGNYIMMNSLLRTAVARSTGFDPMFAGGYEDYDFFLGIVFRGGIGRLLDAPLVNVRIHSASITAHCMCSCMARATTKRIFRKYGRFFTREDKQEALRCLANREMVTLIHARRRDASVGVRLRDTLYFVRAFVHQRHAELFKQMVYCFFPRYFFAREVRPADVFYLYRDTPERRDMLLRLQAGEASGLAGGQLFGFDELSKKGVSVDCNLRLPRSGSVRETVAGWVERAYAPRAGIGLGDYGSVRAHLPLMNRAKVVLATTDNVGLPAVRLKARGELKTPLVYISIGLPERLKVVEAKSPARAKRYRKRLSCVDRFVAYGHEEAEWLRQWMGDGTKVHFIPFGVDTMKWHPMEASGKGPDVLSIGADPMRDFGLLTEYARRHPERGVCLVTSRECAAELDPLPTNLRVKVRVPIEELKRLIADAKVVVFPVKENTYSGATTTLLQSMAMGKAVAVSRVGAIRDGYGFKDGVNVRWMEPGSLGSLTTAVDSLLADDELSRRLGEAARRHVVENLGWDRYVADLKRCWDGWLGQEKKE